MVQGSAVHCSTVADFSNEFPNREPLNHARKTTGQFPTLWVCSGTVRTKKEGALKTPAMMSILTLGWSCALFPFPATGQDMPAINQVEIEKRTEFLQQNFSKFVPMQFQKSTNTEALIQFLPIQGNAFSYQGALYCGFKFILPEWLDGDVQWMYLLVKTEESKKFQARLNFYVIPQTGRA
ncbi:MAG: hypothetical protein HY343_07480, partial [Lentisphaerae bacterium]|nr:hypothetical protein [Lentisphaerota bacterium]